MEKLFRREGAEKIDGHGEPSTIARSFARKRKRGKEGERGKVWRKRRRKKGEDL